MKRNGKLLFERYRTVGAAIGRPVILEQNHIAERRFADIFLRKIQKCAAFLAGAQ